MGVRRNHHQPAAAKLGGNERCQKKVTEVVDRKRSLVTVRRERAGPGDAGIGDDGAQRTHLPDCFGRNPDRSQRGEIDVNGRMAGPFEQIERLGALIRGAPRNNDSSPTGGQPNRGRSSNTAAGAGDHTCFAGNLPHSAMVGELMSSLGTSYSRSRP